MSTSLSAKEYSDSPDYFSAGEFASLNDLCYKSLFIRMGIKRISSLQNHIAEILSSIPEQAWQVIVRKEPEWQHLEPLRKILPQGAFSVFMMMAGLNAFQLKGRAEIAYWPKLHQLLENAETIPSVGVLAAYLSPFYRKERLYNSKLERLKRFMFSPLATRLWKKSPSDISAMIEKIRPELETVMNQALCEKTMCFAMKCLGISLMIAGEQDFAFENIPIPVDSRITKFTKRIDCDLAENSRAIQEFWRGILSQLHRSLPTINMIHLDSLIWQIAHQSADELTDYFKNLGVSGAGRTLIRLL